MRVEKNQPEKQQSGDDRDLLWYAQPKACGLDPIAVASVLLSFSAVVPLIADVLRIEMPSYPVSPLGIVTSTAVLGTALGVFAVRRARVRRAGRTLAHAALCLGVAATFLWVLLLSLSWLTRRDPGLAARSTCAISMRCDSGYISLYAQAHGGQLPKSLDDLVACGAALPQELQCPSARTSNTSVFYAYWGSGLRQPCDPRAVLLTESLQNHNGKGMNVCFADGTVKFIDGKSAKKLLAELEAGHNPPRNWP